MKILIKEVVLAFILLVGDSSRSDTCWLYETTNVMSFVANFVQDFPDTQFNSVIFVTGLSTNSVPVQVRKKSNRWCEIWFHYFIIRRKWKTTVDSVLVIKKCIKTMNQREKPVFSSNEVRLSKIVLRRKCQKSSWWGRLFCFQLSL